MMTSQVCKKFANNSFEMCLCRAKNQKDVIALSLLQQLLGTGPRVKYSAGASPLATAAQKATQNPVAVSGLNISYSDTGLFGFVAASSPDDATKVTKAVVSKMRETIKNIKDEDLKRAKYVTSISRFAQVINHVLYCRYLIGSL